MSTSHRGPDQISRVSHFRRDIGLSDFGSTNIESFQVANPLPVLGAISHLPSRAKLRWSTHRSIITPGQLSRSLEAHCILNIRPKPIISTTARNPHPMPVARPVEMTLPTPLPPVPEKSLT